ncbi:MAG TPA: hypothetical protein IAD11_06190 [Candidatus Stercorousia faecigallinarum]|nr:hypothetical protein [Candidatus Stercorousia faecigallinarum]
MEKVLYFDVEYANAKNKSICQLGLLSEYYPSGEPVFPERNIFINPEDGFQDWCIKVHGITAKQVETEPNFLTVWNDIEAYFTDAVIVGYNVFVSDLSALSKSCARYNIKLPDLYYIDTMRIATDNIPYYEVKDFTLESLCKYFKIDMDKSHDAFDDACATADLFKCLIENFDVNINKYIRKFSPVETKEFVNYVADPVLRRTISEFYGFIQGIMLDCKIKPEEEAFIKQWKIDNSKFESKEELTQIFKTLDKILEDNVITVDEVNELQSIVREYYETIMGSPITNSLQELRGILKGIIVDNKISTEEGENLMKWLYNNIHLSEYYPYNHISSLFATVLEDGIITEKESNSLIEIINSILSPVDSLKEQISCVQNKHVCLSGNFSHGQKGDVEKLITDKGGIIDSGLKKSTDILIIGDYESQAYAHGNYGTKVRKAMEYNSKGCNICILKEADFFANS